MEKKTLRSLILILLAAVLVFLQPSRASKANDTDELPNGEQVAETAPAQAANGIFRDPIVPGSTISGHFDHNPGNDMVTFYDGRHNNSPSYGFTFSCNNPPMYDFVGCLDNVSGEGSCANQRELWYDGHKGTDYEFTASWHTGAVCDPGRFTGLTLPIYAPARGLVFYAGYNHQFNGNHLFILHDANGNGNFYDDNLRAAYLHFAALSVRQGQVVEEGQLLGTGGSTGYSSSPHLHFEVQRSTDSSWGTRWSVDPYGWTGAGADPWPYSNVSLWKSANPPPDLPYKSYLSSIFNQTNYVCTDCTEMLRNTGFESGNEDWQTDGPEIIVSSNNPKLETAPAQGNWLAWLGGYNYAQDMLAQTFTVPQEATGANLQYAFKIVTSEPDGSIFDTMTVQLRTADGQTVLRDLDYVDDNFSPKGQWVFRMVGIDLRPYQGQTIQIYFEAKTDARDKTSFYLDDVTLKR